MEAEEPERRGQKGSGRKKRMSDRLRLVVAIVGLCAMVLSVSIPIVTVFGWVEVTTTLAWLWVSSTYIMVVCTIFLLYPRIVKLVRKNKNVG